MDRARPGVAVIGGSGLYRLGSNPQWLAVTTPYGPPSDEIAVAELAGRSVAFLPRHGRRHTVPPHRINHRANLWALHAMGVERVVAPCAAGSLRVEMAPGHLVVCDQFIDRTGGVHASTYFDGPEVAHVSLADPYCAELRPLAAAAGTAAGFSTHAGGTIVVVAGPRFSTRAESRLHRADGGDLINMTQFPEAALARELGLCYVTLSLVTDYDAGLEGAPDRGAVSQDEVLREFARHTERLRDALAELVGNIPSVRGCACGDLRAIPLAH